MSNVVKPHFKQNHLLAMAEDIHSIIQESACEHTMDVPQIIGVLELVKIQIINDAIDEDYDDE